MVDPATIRRVTFQLLFFGVCIAIIFIKMLPLSTAPSRIPSPDLLFCFTVAFVARRPAQIHAIAIVLIFLLADVLFLRPPGLWPALVLLGLEFLRGHTRSSAEFLRSVEIVVVAGIFAAITALNALAYLVFGLEHPNLGQTGLIVLMTVMAYPFVILTTEFILGVRRARPNEV